MAYYIHILEKNKHNRYKYHYLDHMTTVIDLHENYWTFAIDLYSINDFSLPVNSLTGNLQLPFQEVQNLIFNLATDQTHADDNVEYNKEYARLYTGTFNVDISQNEYFKQDLENVRLNLELNLLIDQEAAQAAGDDVEQEAFDGVVRETAEQRWNFAMYYSNTHLINQSDTVDNTTGYSLPLGNECMPISEQIKIFSKDYQRQELAFNDLLNIRSSVPFQILSGKVKFTYWLELETESKTLEKVLTISHSPTGSTNVSLDDYTFFDYEKNEVCFDPIGVKGFYIPKYSHGYYDVELQVLQNSAISKFIIRNYFNFITNEEQPTLSVVHKVINDLTGYERILIDD